MSERKNENVACSAYDVRNLEDVFKRDYNQLRRNCALLDQMKEDIHRRREELKREEGAIVKKEARTDTESRRVSQERDTNTCITEICQHHDEK